MKAIFGCNILLMAHYEPTLLMHFL